MPLRSALRHTAPEPPSVLPARPSQRQGRGCPPAPARPPGSVPTSSDQVCSELTSLLRALLN